MKAGTERVDPVGRSHWLSGQRYTYRAVIRKGSCVVWRCEHVHNTRDEGQWTRAIPKLGQKSHYVPSAIECAKAALIEVPS